MLKPDKIKTFYNLSDTLWSFHIEFNLIACDFVVLLSERRLVEALSNTATLGSSLSGIAPDLNLTRCNLPLWANNRVKSLLATRSLLPNHPKQQCCTCSIEQILSSQHDSIMWVNHWCSNGILLKTFSPPGPTPCTVSSVGRLFLERNLTIF